VYWSVLFHLFQLKAWGWHLASVMLHGVASWLTLLTARRVLRHEAAAWIAAFLFALHPVHVEKPWRGSPASNDLLMTIFAARRIPVPHKKQKMKPRTNGNGRSCHGYVSLFA